MSQRLFVELTRRGHTITLCVGSTPEGMLQAVARERPDLIIAPMLKTAIPEQVWRRQRCLIVHPGITGDRRGPSSLDWAIALGVERWGVTDPSYHQARRHFVHKLPTTGPTHTAPAQRAGLRVA